MFWKGTAGYYACPEETGKDISMTGGKKAKTCKKMPYV
jgi:hypothetical protein